MTTAHASCDVLPRDLSAYWAGNTGIDFIHRSESGRPGPHVMVNALTHGNEFCGMVAACHLLDTAVRPKIGTLMVSFANVAAYESFDVADPFASRQIDHNLNRIWSDAWLDGDQDSVELQRARCARRCAGDPGATRRLHDFHAGAKGDRRSRRRVPDTATGPDRTSDPRGRPHRAAGAPCGGNSAVG